MQIELKTYSQLTKVERLSLERLYAEAFPPNEITWAHTDLHVLVLEAGEIVSNVEIFERRITVGGVPVHLGGIGGVATLKSWRRRGLAEAALQAAQAYLREPLAVEFGLLICGEPMVHYYAKFGWKLVANELWIQQPQGRVLYHDAPTMVLPVGRSDWPAGEIDLCGLPW